MHAHERSSNSLRVSLQPYFVVFLFFLSSLLFLFRFPESLCISASFYALCMCVCSSKWFLWFSWMFIFLVQELSSSIKLTRVTRDWKLPFLKKAQSRPWHPDENPPQKARKWTFISENVFLSANRFSLYQHCHVTGYTPLRSKALWVRNTEFSFCNPEFSLCASFNWLSA